MNAELQHPREHGPEARGGSGPSGGALLIVGSLEPTPVWTAHLLDAGYRVLLAQDCAEALAMMAAERPRLVLSVYPQYCGERTLLEHVRADPELKGMPLCLVLSRDAPELLSAAAGEGADWVLPTTCEAEDVARKVSALVGPP